MRPLTVLALTILCWSSLVAASGPHNGNCKARADILFILDGSGSIGSSDFADLKSFVAGMTGHFELGPGEVLVGAMVFSSSVDYALPFDKSQTTSAVEAAILNLNYPGGGTDTSEALEFARTVSFNTTNGARSGASRIVVVFTDGRSNSRSATVREAELLKASGVTCLAVGIGSGVNQDELAAIASAPDMTFNVQNFQVLDTILNQLLDWTCPDACSMNASVCTESPNQVCVDLENGFECRCHPGMTRDCNGVCAAPDQCTLDSSLCLDQPHQMCITTDLGHRCECQLGFARDTQTGTCKASTCESVMTECAGREDGDYPSCPPECAQGTYYSCVGGGQYVRTCPLGNFLDAGTAVVMPLVYDPDTSRCQNVTTHCPRPHLALPVS